MTPAEIIARLDRHTRRDTSGCWVWTGAANSRGYSSVSIAGKVLLGHRVSYEAHKGPIPDGLTIDHLCLVKLCINPDHLEAITRTENNARRLALMTHCKRNHPLSGDNLLTHKRQRVCRECSQLGQRDRYAREKGAPVRAYTRRMHAANSPTK